jgi:hypothetical protein
MKLIIPESKLDRLVYRYLDMKNFYVLETSFGYQFYKSKQSMDDEEYSIITFSLKDKDCFYSSDLIKDVSLFFSIPTSETMYLIERWVENKLSVVIAYSYSDFGAD